MEMRAVLKMDQAGASLANMVSKNVKEILLKLVPLSNTISILKLFPLSSAWKLTQQTGTPKASNAQMDYQWTGIELAHAPRAKKELIT